MTSGLLARVLLIGILTATATLKLVAKDHGLQVAIPGWGRIVIAVFELGLAGLLCSWLWRVGATIVLAVAAGAGAIIGYLILTRGSVPSCGCFGTVQLSAGAHLAVVGAIALLALTVVASSRQRREAIV